MRLRRAAGLALASLAAAAATVGLGGPAGASVTPPTDPRAVGYIGICDRSDRQITSGSVNDAPFVWKAVASQAPPSRYLGNGQNVILSVYQLRPQTDPGNWSGQQMVAASYYATSNTPAAIGTTKDDSLATFMQAYPPLDDGLYQLRMFYARPNSGTSLQTYPATYIRVSGSTWRTVGGGSINCAAAHSQSLEVLIGTVAAKDSGGTQVPAGLVHLPSSTPPPDTTTPSGGSTGSGSNPALNAANTQAAKQHSSSNVGLIVVIALLAAAAAGGAVFWLRRRRTIEVQR